MVKYVLGPENSEGRVRKGITCYMCTLIIDRKIPIIHDLNKFFIPEKIGHFQITT